MLHHPLEVFGSKHPRNMLIGQMFMMPQTQIPLKNVVRRYMGITPDNIALGGSINIVTEGLIVNVKYFNFTIGRRSVDWYK